MCEFVENIRDILEPEFVIGVSKVHDVVGHQQNLFHFPQADDTMSQSVHKVQPPCDKHVAREDEVTIREVTES